MKKVRVYELAKEIGMESKVLTAKLIDLGYSVKAYNSSLDESEANEIKSRLSGDGTGKKKAKSVKAAPPVEKKEVVVPTSETITTRTEVDETASETGTTRTETEVEDKRIQAKGKTTIIRRRRKTVQEEVPVVEAAEPAANHRRPAWPWPDG